MSFLLTSSDICCCTTVRCEHDKLVYTNIKEERRDLRGPRHYNWCFSIQSTTSESGATSMPETRDYESGYMKLVCSGAIADALHGNEKHTALSKLSTHYNDIHFGTHQRRA